MKGLTFISGVLFLAFLIAATSIIFWMIMPTINKMQCSITLEKMKNTFVNLDEVVQKVASEGEGSRRTLSINLDEGEIYVDSENNTIYWRYTCPTPVISPRTFQMLGNVIFGSNLETQAYEGICEGQNALVLENEILRVCFKKIGTPEIKVYYNISEVLLSIYQKKLNKNMPLEYLEITIDENKTSSVGYGYTALSRSGHHLPFGEVIAHMESDYGINYNIKFVLESGADFLIIKGE